MNCIAIFERMSTCTIVRDMSVRFMFWLLDWFLEFTSVFDHRIKDRRFLVAATNKKSSQNQIIEINVNCIQNNNDEEK